MNRDKKTTPARRIAALLLLSFCALCVWAQGTPGINSRDFKVTVVKGNKTCSTPGSVVITYRNAVAGFKTLHYELYKEGGGRDALLEVAPNVVAKIPLTDWEDGDKIYVNVKGITADGTQTATYSLNDYSNSSGDNSYKYLIRTIDGAGLTFRSTAVGACSGTSGSLSMAVDMSGFASVEWKIYQGTTLLKTVNSSTPEIPVTVDQLGAGTYRVVARATPACTTTHPTPTTPGTSWDGDVLVMESNATVDAFEFEGYYTGSVVGSCKASIYCDRGIVSGITTLTADLMPKGGGTVIKTMTTDADKMFSVNFDDVPVGDYTVRVTADCGAVVTRDFSVTSIAPSVWANLYNYDQSPCSSPSVQCGNNTPNSSIPSTFRLIKESDNSVVATKTWKWSEGDDQCTFTGVNLQDGEKYLVESDFCGITEKSSSFQVYLAKPNITWENVTPASGICTGQGGKVKIKITTSQGLPLTYGGTLEVLRPDGSVLLSQSMLDGWSGEIVINDVVPLSYTSGVVNNSYITRFTLDCNGLKSEHTYGTVQMNNKYFSIGLNSRQWLDQCVYRYDLFFQPQGTESSDLQTIIDGDFELRKVDDGTLVWQGKYKPSYLRSYGYGYMRIPLPGEGKYVITGRNSCGSYIVGNTIEVKKQDLWGNSSDRKVQIVHLPLPCYDVGEVDINNLDPYQYNSSYYNNGIARDEVLWTLEKDGAPYRTGKFDHGYYYGYRGRIRDLPPGKYKVTVYLACDPTIKIERTFELKAELIPAYFSSTGSCGTKILGTTYIEFYAFHTQQLGNNDENYYSSSYYSPLTYTYRLYNADTGVFYQEGSMLPGSMSGNNIRLDNQKLPNGNYRLEIKSPTLICGGIPAYTYNFTVPTIPDDVLMISSQRDKPDLKITHTRYRANDGSLTVGLYKRNSYTQHAFESDNFPIVFTLRAKNGSLTKTLTAYGAEHNVKFENLPAGLYTISATIDGNTCVPSREVKIETIADDKWSASAHLSPNCNGGKQRQMHVSFRVAGTDPSLATVVYTFKAYVWDDVAADYVLAGSVTGTPGQLTAMVDINAYTGTSAPSSSSCGSGYPLKAYKYTIEAGGEEVYSIYDITDGAYYSNPLNAQKTDATFSTGKGAITARLTPTVIYTPCGETLTIPLRLSLSDKINWTLYKNGGGTPLKTQTVDPFDPVTFDQLAPGQYSMQGQMQKKGCSQQWGGGNEYYYNFEILAPGVHLQATGIDGKCDSDCKITTKVLDDATAFSKVTYTISYTEDEVEKTKVLSTTDATQTITFDGLPAGKYKVKAEAEVVTSDGLRTFTAESEVTLKTESPDMNIIQHTNATRPSFKNCNTGYLAFKFQDDHDDYDMDYARRFTDDYVFTITSAPPGVTVPVTFKPEHARAFYDHTITAITPFRNLPAGEYKVKVTNHCKTLFLTCHIGEIEDLNIPDPFGCVNFYHGILNYGGGYSFDYDDYDDLDQYSGYYGWNYGPLHIRRNKGKYWFVQSPFTNIWSYFDSNSSSNNKYRNVAWEDLITQDIHDSFGHEMTDIPLGWGAKELTVRPWFIDKVTLKFNCPAIADKVFTGSFTTCDASTTYCGEPTVNVTDFIKRARLPETLTLVVNEMNGGTVGAEVLRKVNPNATYSLGTVAKTYLVQLYTADNFLLAKYTMSPVPVVNTMTLETRSAYDCKNASINIRYSNSIVSCYSPYVLKTYKGTGAGRTFMREEIFNTYTGCGNNSARWDYDPNTDYEFELYTANGMLLDKKSIHTASLDPISLPTTYYFGNRCESGQTNTVLETYQLNGKDYNKMYYQLKYFYSDTWDASKHYYYQDNYYCDNHYTKRKPPVLTVVKDGITYKGEVYGLGSTVTGINQWWVERNGKTYQSDGPVFAWDETINGTLTGPDCGLSVNITGKAVKKENNFNNTQLENMTMVQTCTGWDITPGGQVSYTAVDGTRHVLNYKEYQDPYTGQWKKVNVPFAQPKNPNNFTITLRGDDLCDIQVWKYHLVYMPHALNQIESASYFCSSSNKGKIYVGAENGVPPYTYVLLGGEDETSPEVERKVSTGPVVFEYGDVGKKYRVHVFDACGNLRIHYFTTVVSTVDLGYALSKTRQVCAGDALKLTMQSFPGAAYKWTLPDGSIRTTRNLDLGPATTAMGGAYQVVITPQDCASTITATITVTVDDVAAPAWTPARQTVCQGKMVTLSPGAASSNTDGTSGTPSYQWQKKDQYGTTYSDIDGATQSDYSFHADNPGSYLFRRLTSYKGCKHESADAEVVVTPGPIQTLTAEELERTVRKGSTGYTLTGGSLQTNGTSIASYKWERSEDGVTWTTVGTKANYKETKKFTVEKVYYRRTVTPTVGSCAHTTPVITVTFKKFRAAYVNPHLRLRVKDD